MGRQGPCYHCGVASTPLWRTGPPEKPVLCNACGSRWRTKGSLVNYTPLHSRYDSDNCEDYRVMRMKKNISLKKTGEKLNQRKLNSENAMAMDSREFTPDSDYNHRYHKNIDDDTSNRSSSGSAISNSESCARFSSADASDLIGPAQSMVWDAQIPSRKRTCVTRPKQSSVEKLTRDLYNIMHEQASRFSGSSEEELLFESEAPLVSVEIGHGSVLIRHPSSMATEDDSEASSLSQHKGAEDSTEHRISKSGAKSGFTGTPVSGKRFRECSNNLAPEAKCMKSLRNVDYKRKDPIPNDASYFTPTPTNLLAILPTNGSSVAHNTVECEDEFSDQDILLYVPSSGSFAQAELLCPTYTFASQQASASSSSIHPSHFRH